MERTRTPSFFLRLRSVFVIIVLSFFLMAFALAAKAFVGFPLSLDFASFAAELAFGGIGGALVYQLKFNPNRYKIPAIILLVLAAAFHAWLFFVHIDLQDCQFGSALCTVLPYVYIGMLLLIAGMLVPAKQI